MSGRLFVCGGVFFLPLLFASAVLTQAKALSNTAALQPRESFSINLPQIAVEADEETGEFSGVSVVFPESGDQAIIGMGNDFEIKHASHGLEKTLFQKLPGREGQFSKFEVKIITRVNKRFCEAIDTLEHLLRAKSWNRCRYLDAYFPHFLSGWYYLICSARNSLCAMPYACRPPEKEFDVSLSSLKTDARISVWRESADTAAALREAGEVLCVQLRNFQKSLTTIKDLDDPAVPKELTDALANFIKAYFNHPPAPLTTR